MSTTTTTVRTSGPNTLDILRDYEIRETQPQQTSQSENQSSTQRSAPPSTENPPDWPDNHRRVPPYRPVNTNQDFNERSAGQNAAEYVFIQSMLQGVRLNANVAQLWRRTGGKINDRIFRYDVGGEW